MFMKYYKFHPLKLAVLRVSFQNTNSRSRQNTGHVRRNSTKFLQSIITKLFRTGVFIIIRNKKSIFNGKLPFLPQREHGARIQHIGILAGIRLVKASYAPPVDIISLRHSSPLLLLLFQGTL